MKQLGFEHLFHSFLTDNYLGLVVFVVLSLMSLASIYYIIVNAIRSVSVSSKADKVIHGFWAAGSIQDAVRELEAQPKSEPFSKIALDAASAVAHHQQATTGTSGRLAESLSRSEFIDRALRQAVARESLRLEGGLTLLATVGSSAPFVGLLGTVWGIYHALTGIAASGSASMDKVAGPVGEALIMTAYGLFAAIPAVLAYNFFTRANRVIYAKFDEFAHDLHDYFATGARVEGGVPLQK
jgi:biopolymer transport protein ExbB